MLVKSLGHRSGLTPPRAAPSHSSARAGDPAIGIRGLSREFRRKSGRVVAAVDDLSLDVGSGEMIAVVGPSGCGKTTLLRCVAGLERPSAGEVSIGGRVMSRDDSRAFVAPELRGIGMMFQSYALWPHMTVSENVAYPLRCRAMRRKERQPLVNEILGQLGLDGLQNEPPSRLSGGQQQRVALARSLVARPKVVLFDEPLSNVDAKVRDELRMVLVQMHAEYGFSGLYVTHDQEDALQICDRVVVLRQGKVEQSGSPADVYTHPDSVYVAEFVGAVNNLACDISDASDGSTVVLSTKLGPLVAAKADLPHGSPHALIRPHHVELSAHAGADTNSWPGVVVRSMFRGAWMQYVIEVGRTSLVVWSRDSHWLPGQAVGVHVPVQHVIVRGDSRE